MKRIALFITPLAIVAMIVGVYSAHQGEWTGFKYIVLAIAGVIYAACVLRGRLRDSMVVVASLLIGVSAIEAYLVLTKSRGVDDHTPGYSVSRLILGWGPAHAGVFHHTKLAAKTRAPVYEVDYTIDQNLNRQTIAASTGPTVAFVGDSMTFGTGLPDSQTLPQLFADLYARRIGVLNLGFPGYGPQQYLRAIETGVFDKLLSQRARLFVYETAAWHAERASCAAGFMLRAPRYAMAQGRPRFEGACYQDWPALPMELLANTSIYHSLLEPAIGGPSRADINLYIAITARAAELAKQRFGAPTLVLYLRSPQGYFRRSGSSDDEIMRHMREAGLEVIDATLDPHAKPGIPLAIPGDGHPTGAANALRATMIRQYLEQKHPDILGEKTG